MSLQPRGIDLIWLLLMLITLASSLLAESDTSNLFLVMVIAASVTFKGRMVIDRFMELENANPLIRSWMNAYFYVIPVLIVMVHAFPGQLAQWTRLN